MTDKTPDRIPAPSENPLLSRRPTSHEQAARQLWDASYQAGPAPWDIGSPQPPFIRLASAGGFIGSVLDVGCGTGENSLLVAALGLPVLGVDVAETAVAIARQKARDRGIDAQFAVADAFQLKHLQRSFQTVLDCGLFHTFNREERPPYVASLSSVTDQGGTLYILCFSDIGPELGPHPVSRADLERAFDPGTGWKIVAIDPDLIQTRFHDHGASAWIATINRL